MITLKYFFSVSVCYYLFFSYYVVCRISNERRCVDAECSVPISVATTLLRYNADDERLLSFPANSKAKVFSKEAGDKPSFWEAEINGKRGYVPKGLLRENRILVKPSDVKVIVPTGREEEPNQNVTQENAIKTPEPPAVELNTTPELPVTNSKGLFAMIGGVSADSVPPNSPEINPQPSIKSEVIDGTTLYYDSTTERSESPSEEFSEVKEGTPVNEISKEEEGTKEELEKKDQLVIETDNLSKDTTEVKETFSVDVSALGESVLSGKGLAEDKSENTGESQTEAPNENKEARIDKSLSDGIKGANQVEANPAQPVTSETESSVFSDVLSAVSKYMSSGSGEIEGEEEEEDDDEEENEIEKTHEEPTKESEEGSGGKITNLGLKMTETEKTHEEPTKEGEEGSGGKITNLGLEMTENEKQDQEPLEGIEHDILSKRYDASINSEKGAEVEKVMGVDKNGDKMEVVPEIQKQSFSNAETPFNSLNNFREKSPDVTLISEKEDLIKDDEILVNETEIVTNVSSGSNIAENTSKISNDNLFEGIDKESPTQTTPIQTSAEVIMNSSAVEETPAEIEAEADQQQQTILSSRFNREEKSEIAGPLLNREAKLKSEGPLLNSEVKVEPSDPVDVKDVPKSKVDDKTAHTVEDVHKTDSIAEGTDPIIDLTSFNDSINVPNPIEVQEAEVAQDTKPVYEEPEVKVASTRNLLFGSMNIEKDSSDNRQKETAQTQPPESAFERIDGVDNVYGSYNSVNSMPPETTPHPSLFESSTDLPLTTSDASDKTSDQIQQQDETQREKFTINDSITPLDSREQKVDDPVDIPEELTSDDSNEMPLTDQVEILEELPSGTSTEETEAEEISASDQETISYAKIEVVPGESSEGLFNWFNPIINLFGSSESPQAENVDIYDKEEATTSVRDVFKPAHISSSKEEACLVGSAGEGNCESIMDITENKEVTWQESIYTPDMAMGLDLLSKVPVEVTVWLVVTAVVVLIFSLGHYYIEAHRRDGPLVAIINKLEREVLILKKERCILEDSLQTSQQQVEDWNTSSSENDALIVELKQELDETKSVKAELEEQVAALEREVESVTENGLEIHRLLEESLSSQDGSQVLLSTVETLREKLERQEDEIVGLSQSLNKKNAEVEELEQRLSESAEVARSLEDRVVAVSREKEEEALQLRDKHRQLMAQLEEVIETKALDETRVSADMSKLRLTIEELQKRLAEGEAELEEVKEVVKQLRSTDSNEKMDALFDVVGMRAQLKTAVTERDDFREKFQEEEGARKLMEGHMKKITQEVAELKNSFETAEKEKIEALTKLQVLSNYFKEKESQLQKELGMQESMWLQKQSDDHTIYEQMRSLREENEKYKVVNGEATPKVAPTPAVPKLAEVKTKKKSNPKIGPLRQAQGLQNESLKKEIVEQESSFKIQLANVEQKSHENWVASRQAERKVKEAQQEAAQLRNRLTMEKTNFSLEESKQSMSESNGDPSSPPPSLMYPPTTSPPFMMYPMPPPGDFVPPPPLVGSPYPSDSRPPPLGRISSPPLDHRFSPPPPLPYPPYDYAPYGHHSPSPPPPMPSHPHHRTVHKPQPREVPREPKEKDHSMSTYSTEGEKSTRRNKR